MTGTNIVNYNNVRDVCRLHKSFMKFVTTRGSYVVTNELRHVFIVLLC
jgi:hypothetical protein